MRSRSRRSRRSAGASSPLGARRWPKRHAAPPAMPAPTNATPATGKSPGSSIGSARWFVSPSPATWGPPDSAEPRKICPAYLKGLQDLFLRVGGQQGARSRLHPAELFRLADAARVLADPALAARRMSDVLAVGGIH